MYYNTIPEIQVKYKKGHVESFTIENSKSAADCVKKFFNADTIDWSEEFLILLLDRQNKTIGWYKVSQGGMSSTVVDPKIVFSVALKAGASGLILAHNHPSGNLKPSDSDKKLTQKIKEGGKILDISILDHLIITSESYYSMSDEFDM